MGGADTHAVARVLATNRRAPPASDGTIVSGLGPSLPRQHALAVHRGHQRDPTHDHHEVLRRDRMQGAAGSGDTSHSVQRERARPMVDNRGFLSAV